MNVFMELLFNAGSGGLFGLAGSLATTWMRLKEKSVDNAHALKMAEVTFRGTEQIEAWKAFTSSHQSASGLVSEKASTWAINTQIVTRPSLTLLLVVASTLSTLIHPVTPEQAMAIQNVQILTGTAVAWWFGSRMTTQITPSTGAVPIRKG